MYNTMENYRNAVQYFDSSFYHFDRMNATIDRMEALMGAAYAHEALGNYKQSSIYLRTYIDLAGKSHDEAKERVAEELKQKYETEKKEQENLRLLAENDLKDVKFKQEHIEKELQQTHNKYLMIGLFAVFLILIGIVVALSKVRTAKREAEAQKFIVEEKNREITDSIQYAKHLQKAILPSRESITAALPWNFIFYQPKDIVAGDFYWLEVVGHQVLIAAADCTGHGVPGAMVSVVCHNALNRSVREFGLTDPGKILDKTRELVIETFEKSGQEVKDGMDISLLAIHEGAQIKWSGANNPLWYIEDGKMNELKPDKQPVGKSYDPKPFTTHSLTLAPLSTLFLFTDGFADQFGGDKGKKLKYKSLREILAGTYSDNPSKQCEALALEFKNWMGNFEQIDDVCIVGIRI